MPGAVERIVQTLRFHSLNDDAATQSDRRLLEAFAAVGDEAAFAELVRRHGPLVLGVCRRILGNAQDAEDAFQATFLVLARKAGSLGWRDSIKNWLHGVACRVAMKARAKMIRRRQKEQEADARIPTDDPPVAAWKELRTILDEEMEQLPDKYRAVLILCYLEGKTRDEAAETLGWSLGAVKGCLDRGREMLRGRLARRGLALSMALVAGLLSDATLAAAPLSATLVSTTVQSASLFIAGSTALAPSVLSLAQGALNAMLIAKIKTVGLVTMSLVLGAGSLLGIHYAAADRPVAAAVRQDAEFVQEKKGEGERKDGERKEGERKDGERKTDPFGIVKELDLKVGTITITGLRDGDGGDQVYSLAAKDLKVDTTFGESLKINDVVPGMRVHLQLKGQDVAAVHVENPVVPAFLNSVDATNRTVEARAERKIANYKVAPDAKITIAGKPGRLADVPVETRLFLTLSFDKKTILALHTAKVVRRDDDRPGVEAPKKEGDRPKAGDRPVERPVERPALGNATIVDFDADKGTVNLLLGRDGDLQIKTLNLPKDAKIKVMFGEQAVQEITAAQLAKPLQAAVKVSEDGKSVETLVVLAPVIRAGVKAVDPVAKKLTIVNETRVEKSLDIDAAAAIRLQGRPDAKLADLSPGMQVLIGLSLDRQRVIGVTVVPARRDGDR